MPQQFIDDNGITNFIDQNGVILFIDDNGIYLGDPGGDVVVTSSDLNVGVPMYEDGILRVRRVSRGY